MPSRAPRARGRPSRSRRSRARCGSGSFWPLSTTWSSRCWRSAGSGAYADRRPGVDAPRVDTHEAVEHGLDLVLVGNLDEERGAELARLGQEGVVNVELVPDLGIIRDALDAAHLLDLEEHGVPVLEYEGKVPAHRHPPHALQIDHALAHPIAHLLVLEEVQDVLQLDLVVPHESQ